MVELFRISKGREFQMMGPATEKLRDPKPVRTRGTNRARRVLSKSVTLPLLHVCLSPKLQQMLLLLFYSFLQSFYLHIFYCIYFEHNVNLPLLS